MAITNQERIGKAMELFREGVAPFVERESGREIGRLVREGGTPRAEQTALFGETEE